MYCSWSKYINEKEDYDYVIPMDGDEKIVQKKLNHLLKKQKIILIQ